MRRRFVAVLLGSLVATAVAAPAIAGRADGGPNQGDPRKVFTVHNPNVFCEDPVPSEKFEGDFGQVIHVSASDPIDFVTIKSGKDAYRIYRRWDTTSGTIKISKDVSNYVIWTCPDGSTPYPN